MAVAPSTSVTTRSLQTLPNAPGGQHHPAGDCPQMLMVRFLWGRQAAGAALGDVALALSDKAQ